MIVTITMNPAIDKTVYVEKLIPGTTHRVNQTETDFGGKGINVAKVLTELGGKCLAMGLMPEDGSGQMLEDLEKAGISHRFHMVKGRVRTNTKLVEADGSLTEINEPGCNVSQKVLNDFYEELAGLGEATVVLTGSLPEGVPKECYAHIIEVVKSQGGKVLLDADGEGLVRAIAKCPDILKINELEFRRLAETFLGWQNFTTEQICESLIESGVGEIIITRGPQGVIYYSKELQMSIPAIKTEVSSTVGAGDTFGAAYLYARELNFEVKKSLYFATAAATAAVETKGTKVPELARIDALFKQYFLSENAN